MSLAKMAGTDDLRDRFGRPINNLRICVTQRCNMDCFFCHREGEAGVGAELSASQICAIIRAAAELGIQTLKITGGEPLLRPDLEKIISFASKHMSEVSLTTNGFGLAHRVDGLRKAGLDRVNVSLHSLARERFKQITGVDALDKVLEGIRCARNGGLSPVKVNFVALKDVNADEIEQMIAFAARNGVWLQIIEHIPLGKGRDGDAYHLDLGPVESDLQRKAIDCKVLALNQRRRYRLAFEENTVEVEIVRPIHNAAFCANCSRLRVTSDGKLKPCLLRNDNLVDLKPLLGKCYQDAEIQDAFRRAIFLREPYWRMSS